MGFDNRTKYDLTASDDTGIFLSNYNLDADQQSFYSSSSAFSSSECLSPCEEELSSENEADIEEVLDKHLSSSASGFDAASARYNSSLVDKASVDQKQPIKSHSTINLTKSRQKYRRGNARSSRYHSNPEKMRELSEQYLEQSSVLPMPRNISQSRMVSVRKKKKKKKKVL